MRRLSPPLLVASLSASLFLIVYYSSSFSHPLQEKETLVVKRMPMKVVDSTVSTFDSIFEKFKLDSPNNRANFILFLADKDPSTSLSWCPDCVRAEPDIYKKLEATDGDVALLRAYVGDRPTWRNPQHPWRVDSIFKLTGVPTLILWDSKNQAVAARLEDHEAHIEHKIDALSPPNKTLLLSTTRI
ncbi:thioredoxin-like protein Clot isoform X2 [Hibiscus syriacus]|uniref:thioredoxin-like protein Clot isoform X2 n=1 Tax=Hibiscus syriacus TaxID=106335 RepID=UPI001920C6A7|nr:thioredoxin-like protein Clot isoform X2 [Hibiscus syriacus]